MLKENTDFTDADYIRYIQYDNLPSSESEYTVLLDLCATYETMPEKEKHKRYLRTKFYISCSREIFNNKEIEILENYGAWMEALYLHKINPITKEQINFLEQIDKGIISENIYTKTGSSTLKE